MKLIYPFIFMLILSCSTTLPVDNKWEGIKGNILRVSVYEFAADEDDVSKVKENIIEAGKARGALLLVSYSSLTIERTRVNPTSDALLNKAISEIIEKGSIVSMDLRDTGYSLAFIEYDITDLNEVLNKINMDKAAAGPLNPT